VYNQNDLVLYKYTFLEKYLSGYSFKI